MASPWSIPKSARGRRCRKIFRRIVIDKNAVALDLGLAGEALANLGYTRIGGADFSAQVLVLRR